ncbi:putative NHN endonuclease [Bacillus phage vB_BcoS-136]|uniref:Putative NHN endonuclease n=1 Tax=Bacillus phage vB_BcoS-136 TaxID=2419619 RepID=A0A3G3BVM3_9CAUD|nr:putative NHN endonuclease [Bacillus phage vB_BcoS-136]AYP68315.1 putative NHN endonuclease [Bacillus phage vB_BcoS-136]
MKEIILTTGQKTIVDKEDYDMLTKFSQYWRLSGRYVICVKEGRVVRMHRLIMNPKDNEIVDHKNNNTLDNRKSNLRITDYSGNSRNASKTKSKTTSKYKGVSWCKNMNAWKVYCGKEHLGYYSDEIAGAIIYNQKAIELFGEYAKLNDVEGIDIITENYLIKRKKKSKYKGITFNKSKNKWEAQIYHNKKTKKIGTANTEDEAYSILLKYIADSDDKDLKNRYLNSD